MMLHLRVFAFELLKLEQDRLSRGQRTSPEAVVLAWRRRFRASSIAGVPASSSLRMPTI
jgi:hypothetical protein